MRTVSFSKESVRETLKDDFVCTHSSIEGDRSAGHSLKHRPQDTPGLCGRGAGRQNVQTVFLTPNNEIFHVVTGFLDGDDLLEETRFAKRVFRELGRRPKQAAAMVVALHTQRLRDLGFDMKEIQAPENMMSEMLATSFSPEDLGMQFGRKTSGIGSKNDNMFQQMNRQRILKDHRFVMNNPLLERAAFDAAPQELVGRHSSFFGSAGGPQTEFIQQMNQRMQGR